MSDSNDRVMVVTEPGDSSVTPEPTAHPRPRYKLILALLVLLTGVEVGVSYLPEGVRLPLLIVLAVAKALLVILWFMHLKFDARVFALIFVMGFLLLLPLLYFIGFQTPFGAGTEKVIIP